MLMGVLLLLTLLTGVRPRTPEELYVRTGEMVALHCPQYNQQSSDGGKLVWTHHSSKQTNLTKDVSASARLKQMDALLQGTSLVILRAGEIHNGNYSCSFGKASCESWFRLTVYPAESNAYERNTQYPVACFAQDPCKLTCPDVNTPPANTPHMTSFAVVWHKGGDPSEVKSYFSSADTKDSGVYSCTRSYLYQGQRYYKTFSVALKVKPNKKFQESRITEPQKHQVVYVDVDSPAVIDCKAVLYSEFDEVFWLSKDSFVEQNASLPVFYNYTSDQDAEETRVTASLIFQKVSEEDLSKYYTCKLESDHQLPTFVTITLTQNAAPSSLRLALCIVCLLVLILLTVFLSMKFKVDVALFLRDTLGCCHGNTDGNLYDACWMCYKSDADAALSGDDSKWLVNVLEERFGYSISLCNDAELDTVVAADVLDRIAQSCVVVLVPTSAESAVRSDILGNIQEALQERRTHCISINTEAADSFGESSLPEALLRVTGAGRSLTWRGRSSKRPTSSFCKQLRYLLPAPQHAPRHKPHRHAVGAYC